LQQTNLVVQPFADLYQIALIPDYCPLSAQKGEGGLYSKSLLPV